MFEKENVIFAAVEKDDADIVTAMHEDIAVGTLQRGAGHDIMCA